MRGAGKHFYAALCQFPFSATKADILELFGLDKALAKSARCI